MNNMDKLKEFSEPVFRVVSLPEAKKKQLQVRMEQKAATSKAQGSEGSRASRGSRSKLARPKPLAKGEASDTGIAEFYNSCHGPEDGRFCEGEGGTKGRISGRLELSHEFMPEYKGDYDEKLEVGTPQWVEDNKRVNQEAWWDFTEAEDASYTEDTNTFFKRGPLRDAHKGKTPAEAEAFKDYQKEGYIEVNDYLNGKVHHRSFWDPDKNEAVDTYEPSVLSDQGRETIENMDTAFATKGVRPGRGVFFRGITNPEEYGQPVDLSKYSPGTVITHDGFMSTSTSKDLTETLPNEKDAMLRIRTNGDSDISAHLGKQTEKEVIFNRGTSLYIRNQYVDREGRTVIDAEAL